jgi:hypothetical protein
VFDTMPFVEWPSAAETAMRRMLQDAGRLPVFVLQDYRPHGGGSTAGADDELVRFGQFRRLLETGAEQLAAAKAAQAEQARQAAVQARALAAFARSRPADLLDRPDEEIGAAAAASRAARPAVMTEVSEWAVDEVAEALHLSGWTAQALLAESITLVEKLPATLDALGTGALSPAHARMLTEVLGPLNDESRASVEAALLARAAGKTVAELKQAARRAVLRADAAAANKRMAAAVRDRKVVVHPGEDGMATLAATLPTPVALACRRALEAHAEAAAAGPGDDRTKDQRMSDAFADLLLRPGTNPPVQVGLTVVATAQTLAGSDEPGEVDGQVVPAVVVRELAYTFGLLPRPDTAATADEALATRTTAADLAALLGTRTTAATALAQLPTIAVVDELSGQLLALTDAGELRRAATCDRKQCRAGRSPCTHTPASSGLGPPRGTPGYVPSDRMARFVRARDRRCRFPGCRARAIVCDLDHTIPWPGGPTSAANLCSLCRHHHRLRHQAPGWAVRTLPDGGLEWTTPGGHTVTTYPPRYGSDDDLPPPGKPEEALPVRARLPLTAREHVLGRPLPEGAIDDDPPPF